MIVKMPIKTVSEANQSEHWVTKYRRKKAQQRDFRLLWRNKKVNLPCTITFTRFSCKTMDTDNLAGSFKHVQDSLASIIGVDDGTDRIEWKYKQTQIPKREHWITVEVKKISECEHEWHYRGEEWTPCEYCGELYDVQNKKEDEDE